MCALVRSCAHVCVKAILGDVALRSSLERTVTASGPGFGDWQWRLATLPFAFGGLGIYSAGDVLNYAFLFFWAKGTIPRVVGWWVFALPWSVLSPLLGWGSATGNGDSPPYPLHLGGGTKLLRHVGIVASGSTFDDALSAFNTSMEIDFLSNPSEIAAPKLMKKMADIYFTWVTKDAISTFSLSSRQMALWKSQKEDHTSN
ncbi:hypothetical protein Tco_0017055 [Tanacetum coccineum]